MSNEKNGKKKEHQERQIPSLENLRMQIEMEISARSYVKPRFEN